MSNDAQLSTRERIALVMGWKRTDPDKLWIGPKGCIFEDHELLPWNEDDGLAIKMLEEFCDEHSATIGMGRHENGEWGVTIYIGSAFDFQAHCGRNQPLAAAICAAVLAANEETKNGMA